MDWQHVATEILGCDADSLVTSSPAPFVSCQRYTVCAVGGTGSGDAGGDAGLVSEYCVYEGMQHVYPTVAAHSDIYSFSDYTGVGTSWQATPV